MKMTIVYGRASGKTAAMDQMFEEGLTSQAELAREKGCGLTVEQLTGARLIYIDEDVPVGEVIWK